MIKHLYPYRPSVAIIDDLTMRGMAIRLDMLQTHYRQPKNFQLAGLNAAAKTLRRWYARMVPSPAPAPCEFVAALMDDLNTPRAITLLHSYVLGLLPPHVSGPQARTSIPLDSIALPAWERVPAPGGPVGLDGGAA